MAIINCKLTSAEYPVVIEAGCLANLSLWEKYVVTNKVVIITSTKVANIYLVKLKNTLSVYDPDVIILEDGEQVKTINYFNLIVNRLLEMHHDRKTILIALGGGTIGDLVGFVASCFFRGIDFIQVPTTLLSQADASIGGKNGINNNHGKNIIGTFYQPKAVFIDPLTLKTLSKRELNSGLSEVVKYGLIADNSFYDWLRQNISLLDNQNDKILTQLIEKTIKIKINIISQDELDKGRRHICNFGHSFGHAVEKFFNFNNYLHGEAVAIGMTIAAKISHSLGYLTKVDIENIIEILSQLQLPTVMPSSINLDRLIDLMKTDKKNQDGKFNLIMLRNIGEASLWNNVSPRTLKKYLSIHLADGNTCFQD